MARDAKMAGMPKEVPKWQEVPERQEEPKWLGAEVAGVRNWQGCQNRNVRSSEFDAVVRAVNQQVVLVQPA